MNEKTSKSRDVDAYIADADRDARPILKELRQMIRTTIPEAEEGISWGVPFYKYRGPLAGFAAYKNHVSVGLGAAVLHSSERDMLEQKGYRTGKKTVQIKFDQKVPTAAIKQILRAQAKVNDDKAARK
jgi:uncharacterized protein YdhG (YjbR/CyaY superfamily)